MKKAIINSAIALTTASLLTVILHELAHYLTAILLGYDATLYHNRVVSQDFSIKMHEVLFVGLAPVFSLVSGFIAYHFSKRLKANSFSLFVLWFGVSGILSFFGYLMIAPIIAVGDTGRVFHLLNVPMIVQILLAVIAVILITIILIRSTDQFERFAIEQFGDTRKNRSKWAIALILFPLLINMVVVTLLQFPISHIISILPSICLPFSIMAVFGTFMGRKNEIQRDLNGESINIKFSPLLIGLFVLAIIVNRVLVIGI